MRRTVLIVAAAAVSVSMAAASCGSDGNSAPTPASSGPARSDGTKAEARAADASRESVTDRTFGPACAKVRATGTGGRSGMASVPVVTAASRNPLLTDLARAAGIAGLTSTLNSASAVTVFAPDNAAFKALGRGNYKTLMAHKADLAKVLEYHVVKGRVTPAELAERKPLTTLAGLPVHPVRSRNFYKVNGARVICGNLHAANATIYIVNEVLVPTP